MALKAMLSLPLIKHNPLHTLLTYRQTSTGRHQTGEASRGGGWEQRWFTGHLGTVRSSSSGGGRP